MVAPSPAGALGLDVLAWDETDDPFARLAAEATAPARRRARRGWRWATARGPSTRSASSGRCRARCWSWPRPVLDRLRMRKSPAEVEELAAAGAAIDRVHARMGEWLRPGRTEPEVGADIAAAILAEGHVGVDFTIVGSGPNGASPHHEVSDRVIARGRRRWSSTSAAQTADRLLLRLHPHLRRRPGRPAATSPSGTRCCRPRRRRPPPRSARA